MQFNPDSLRVSYGNQVVQPSSSGNVTEGATQWVGTGTTRLSLALVFDVTAPPLDEDPAADVRKATAKVIALVTPGTPEQRAGEGEKAKPITVHPAPKVRFDWGSFRFDGYVDSIEESLEHFSADGRPLRSSIQLALSTQEIQHAFDDELQGAARGRAVARRGGHRVRLHRERRDRRRRDRAGHRRRAPASAASWQQIAAANGIENPRMLAPGAVIDLGIGVR